MGPLLMECTVGADRLPALMAALFPQKPQPVVQEAPEGEAESFIRAHRPAGFPQTIALAARYLIEERGFDAVTRGDIRDVLRTSPGIRMPKNFNRDFSLAVEKGYLEDLGDSRRFGLSIFEESYV